MPAKSAKQYRLMVAVAHGKLKGLNIPESVAKKFVHETSEDKRSKFMKAMHRAKLVVFFLLSGATVEAQSVINPRILAFTPSADHSVTLSDGRAKIERYESRWFAQGATSPMQVDNLGKPDPVNGTISINIVDRILGFPIGVGYTCKVAVVGPTGEGLSAASNPFELASQPVAVTNVTLSRSQYKTAGGLRI